MENNMVITYYGSSCFKIQSGDATLAFDIPAKKSCPATKGAEIKTPHFHADIVAQSHNQEGAAITKEEAFLIDNPGEYEIKGVFVRGIKAYHDSVLGKKHGIVNIYAVRAENIVLGFWGHLGEKELRPEVKEALGKIDILIVPIGGESVLDPEEAKKIANQIEPSIIIPMLYSRNKEALKKFLSEFGQKDIKPLEKLSLKKKDIIEDKGANIILLSQI